MPKRKAPTSAEQISARREQLREEHAQAVREKIQTTQLVNVLETFALGRGRARLSPARLKAIEMLLDKTLPNLASVKHEVEGKSVVFLIDTEFKPEPAPVEPPRPDA